MPLAGISGAMQYSQFWLENTWATFNGSATTKPWVELEPGGLEMSRKPITKDSKVASTNVPGRRVATKYEVTGTYKTKMFPALMHAFVPWACTPTVVSGKLTLPSFTIDWFDGLEPRRFRGVRVEEATFEFTNEAQWGMATFKLRAANQDATPPTMVEPAVSAYPTVDSYNFLDTAGFISVGGVVTGYRSAKITYKNILDPQWDEFQTLNSLDYCGREITWEVELKNTSTTYKTAFEAQSAVAGLVKASRTIAGPVTHTTQFDLQAANYYESRDPSRDFDKTQYQKLTLKAFRDPSTGLDCVATSAAA